MKCQSILALKRVQLTVKSDHILLSLYFGAGQVMSCVSSVQNSLMLSKRYLIRWAVKPGGVIGCGNSLGVVLLGSWGVRWDALENLRTLWQTRRQGFHWWIYKNNKTWKKYSWGVNYHTNIAYSLDFTYTPQILVHYVYFSVYMVVIRQS